MFERISVIQGKRGPHVGQSVMRFIVDAELEAIDRATAASERWEAAMVRTGSR